MLSTTISIVIFLKKNGFYILLATDKSLYIYPL
jgi:hypothetical protein